MGFQCSGISVGWDFSGMGFQLDGIPMGCGFQWECDFSGVGISVGWDGNLVGMTVAACRHVGARHLECPSMRPNAYSDRSGVAFHSDTSMMNVI